MVTGFKKNKKRNSSHSFLLALGCLVLLFIVVYLIVANVRIYQKKREFLFQVENLQNQIKDLQNRNNDLKEGIENTDNPDYIEKVAREELDLQKKREQTVSFIIPEPQDQNIVVEQKNIIQIWFGWLNKFWSNLKDGAF